MVDRILCMRRCQKTSVSVPRRRLWWRANSTLLLLLGLAAPVMGCGQKGPLTLPGAAKGSAAQSASAPARQ
jgi:predicted small lipoprotein YifL